MTATAEAREGHLVMKPLSWQVALLLVLVTVPARAARPVLPVYPNAATRQFTGALRANQIPLQAEVFTTRDDMARVLEFYRSHLQAQKLRVVENPLNEELTYIGYYDEAAGLMQLATVMKQPGGGCLIILSAMDPRPLAAPAPLPRYVPRPAAALETVTAGGEEQGRKFLSVSYLLRDVDFAAARSLVVKEARRLGWSIEQEGRTPQEGLLTMKQPGRMFTAQFLKLADRPGQPIRVSLVFFDVDEPGKESRK